MCIRDRIEGGSSVDERLTYGFRLATSRRPTSEELKVLVVGFNDDIARFQANPEATKQYLSFGTSQRSETVNASELAAYALTANVLLNLDEVVTRE